MTDTSKVRTRVHLVWLGLMLGWLGLAGDVSWGEISATAHLVPSGDGVEIEYRSDGESWKDLLPLYRSGESRYFSAGVGMAERSADYPKFPLKIVLTAGGKPYVARVDVHIAQSGGADMISIPADHVTGPWLFVDLPAGLYDITGNRGVDTQQLKRVQIKAGSVLTVYLRFATEGGP